MDGVALRAPRVIDAHAEHLIASANAEDGLALPVSFPDSVCHTFLLQMTQVVDSGLAAWKDDDVGP